MIIRIYEVEIQREDTLKTVPKSICAVSLNPERRSAYSRNIINLPQQMALTIKEGIDIDHGIFYIFIVIINNNKVYCSLT